MNRFGYILAIAMASGVFAGKSQTSDHRNSVTVGWGVSIPAGNGNFAGKASWVSPSLDWEYRLLPVLSAAVSAGYAYFDEKGVTRDRFDGDITDGYTSRTLSLLPLQVGMRYFPFGAGEGSFQPYLFVAGGVRYARFHITGDLIPSGNVKNWSGVVTPGVGLRYHPRRCKKIWLDLRGSWQWGGNGWVLLDTKSQRSVGVNVGVGVVIF